MKKLPPAFYHRTDIAAAAREILGKWLVTRVDGLETIGRIVEVEAYAGRDDKASHAYGGRRTARTEVMYAGGGLAYVYLCYGIHHLFNVVMGPVDQPLAILVRGVEPVKGLPVMMERMAMTRPDHRIGRGPGNVSRALGIHTGHSGIALRDNLIFIANTKPGPELICAGPRIGVDYAGADALLPYRFYLAGNPYVSGVKNKKSNL